MSKRFFHFFLSIQLVASLVPFAVRADVVSGVGYLRTQPESDWRTIALAASGEQVNIDYLRGAARPNARDKARQILAIVAAGQDPHVWNGEDRIAEFLQQEVRAGQIGDPAIINDDFWGIMALRGADVALDHQAIRDSIASIRVAQNQNGGWSWTAGAAPDVDDTAAALMALRSAGIASDDRDITEAVAWLRTTQLGDGGFPNMPGVAAVSNAGSDAWVVSALHSLGVDPRTWLQQGRSPVDHLNTLQQADGGFAWTADRPQSNAQMTAYAVVALQGKYYPVRPAQQPAPAGGGNQNNNPPPQNNEPLIAFRIEGRAQSVCTGSLRAMNALQVVERAASQCGFTYVIQQQALGSYLYQINNEAADGALGWMYRVDWISPDRPAADYVLADGDVVLWSFSQFGEEPLRLVLNPEHPARGENVRVTVEEYNSLTRTWATSQNGRLVVDGREQPLPLGATTMQFVGLGEHTLKARKAGRIASQESSVVIGGANAQADLHVVVEQPAPAGGGGGGGGQVGGDRVVVPEIALTLSRANVDFGTIAAGATAQGVVSVRNTGLNPMYVESVVSGDAVFTDGVGVNGRRWQDFSGTLVRDAEQQLQLSLTVPPNTPAGEKRGTFIVWAVRAE
ncbi:MAG: DUF4430 domain-containing protein [bacterium]|nr:DUF4430 domain-containing protein [bacterium]